MSDLPEARGDALSRGRSNDATRNRVCSYEAWKQHAASSDWHDPFHDQEAERSSQTRIRGRARCMAGLEAVRYPEPRRLAGRTRNYRSDVASQGTTGRSEGPSAVGP